ncbi:hypothetical protein OHV64_17695, partial [Acinetobacter baumannii]|nr:hypothetical protein [Acinetobacter baumannii]
LALMVVWDYPCESKSSPAHYSKHPQPWLGVFFYMGNQSIKNYFKYRTTNYFWMLTRFYGYNEEVFYFWCPREN